MRLLTVTFTVLMLSAASVSAQSASIIERYFTALDMDTVFEVLRDEGVEAGQDLSSNDGVTLSPAWTARLKRIYDPQKAKVAFLEGMKTVEGIEESEAAVVFFESDLGKRIVQIEIDARKALNSDAGEAAAAANVAKLRKDDPALYLMYQEFIKANDLIESNVAGALNSNLAFYRGMATNENYAEGLSESFMLNSVWEQEPEIRKEMEDWTINFSSVAYSGLSKAELQRYIDISKTPAGQRLNTVLFAGFDQMFEEQSYELGRATAEFMIGEDT
ncbi:DUF2059 domain-containing protein [Litoreibacter janthinus]|uniref:Uncharacterized protein n=1 Tax=Litoreibacter janthinus TaxID=670154 RepID=A0A1I6H6L2_9RHOB|nr:DUF2059 domain-containing protein [Litoreibacter janthinus]SFR49941.1 hypothetical protein SAMN04488002_2579 [Litoreibacter janthinus]